MKYGIVLPCIFIFNTIALRAPSHRKSGVGVGGIVRWRKIILNHASRTTQALRVVHRRY